MKSKSEKKQFDILDMIKYLDKEKFKIFLISFLFGIFGFFYTNIVSSEYKVSVIISPASIELQQELDKLNINNQYIIVKDKSVIDYERAHYNVQAQRIINLFSIFKGKLLEYNEVENSIKKFKKLNRETSTSEIDYIEKINSELEKFKITITPNNKILIEYVTESHIIAQDIIIDVINSVNDYTKEFIYKDFENFKIHNSNNFGLKEKELLSSIKVLDLFLNNQNMIKFPNLMMELLDYKVQLELLSESDSIDRIDNIFNEIVIQNINFNSINIDLLDFEIEQLNLDQYRLIILFIIIGLSFSLIFFLTRYLFKIG
tara:strand:- start:100 stop:1047 length:948 start_codon:yes stop_codon:yes gene_type:complete